MTNPLPDTDRILAELFAEDAPPHEPPLLISALLARTALTRQRSAWRVPSWWLPASLAWRPRTHERWNAMFAIMRVAALGAVLALAGGVYLSSLTASPSPDVPTPSPSPIPLPVGDLEAGTTYAIDIGAPQRLVLTVPAPGWFTIDPTFLGKNEITDVQPGAGSPSYYDVTLVPYLVENLHADPCRWNGSVLDPAVGPTVDDLAAALMDQPSQNASSVADVTLGGYAGKKVELSIPEDINPTAMCFSGNYGRWYSSDPSDYGPFTYGSGQRDSVFIIDVEGTRWVIDAIHVPGTSDADLAELDALLASIRFEPVPAAPPSPSPSA